MEPNPSIPWNVKGKNGIDCFFSEETYSRFLGKDTFEARLERNLKKVGIHLPPLLHIENYQNEPSSADGADSMSENEVEQMDQSDGYILEEGKDTGHMVDDATNKKKNRKGQKRKTKSNLTFQKDLHRPEAAEEPHENASSHKREEIVYDTSIYDNNGNETAKESHVKLAEQNAYETKEIQMPVSVNTETVQKTGESLSLMSSETDDKPFISETNLKKDKTVTEADDTAPVAPVSKQLKKHEVKETSPSQHIEEPGTEEEISIRIVHKAITPTVHTEETSDGETAEKPTHSVEGEDKTKDQGNQKKEKDKKFHERKRDSSFLKERMRYDKAGQYIPCIVSLKPRKWSSLLYKEQHRYLTLTHKYRQGFPNYPTAKEIKEIEEFKELEIRVKKEQVEYNEFLKDMFDRCAEDYDYILPDAKRYVDEKLSHVLPRVNMYLRYYNLQEKVSLTVPNLQPGPVLQFIRPLLELGIVPKAVLPSMLPNAPLPVTAKSYARVNENYPASRPVMKEHLWNHEPCSRDCNAEELGMRHGINIVMSASALKCLIDTQDTQWGKHWELPVTVKEYDVFDGEKKIKHKVVYLDKPVFQTSALNSRDKNFIFYKSALKSLIIRQKQRGHVFTNVKTPQLLETSTSQVQNVRFQRPEESEIPKAVTHNMQFGNNSEIKSKASPDVTDQVIGKLKRRHTGRAKTDEILPEVTESNNDTKGGDDIQVTRDTENSNIQNENDISIKVLPQKGEMSKSGKLEHRIKSSGGMFDLESGAIDDLETFGMETGWKAMSKGKHLAVSGTSAVKKRTVHREGEISELEKLKYELKGLQTKAKKETEKVHILGITTPLGKFYPKTSAKESVVTVGSGIQILEDPVKGQGSSKSGNIVPVTEPTEVALIQDCTVKSGKGEDRSKAAITHSGESSKPPASKQVLNLSTVETLASSGLQLSSSLGLRKRSIPTARASEGLTKIPSKDMGNITKSQTLETEIEADHTKESQKTYSLRSKKVFHATNMESSENDNLRIRDTDDDETGDEDGGLVIDVPDLPGNIQDKFASVNDSIDRSITPMSPPRSPPASPPGSPPASPGMENPASPVNDTPISPDKTFSSPRGSGLRNTCVIIPLGDDSMDQNVIDHSINMTDYSIQNEDKQAVSSIKHEEKLEDQIGRNELDIQNFEKFLMSPLPSRPEENLDKNGALKSSETNTKSSVQYNFEKQSSAETELNSVVSRARRSSLRSAGKVMDKAGAALTKEAVQTRRQTRQSAIDENTLSDKTKHDKKPDEADTSSEAETNRNVKVLEDVGPWTRRRHSEIVQKERRLTRSRSSSHDKNDDTKNSPKPERRLSRHSLDSLQSKAKPPEEEADEPVVHKKRKTHIIESDDEDEAEMETNEADTSQSIKSTLAEKWQTGVVVKQHGKRGRPPKVKKAQNKAEADKIKELAEKLKQQMKEKHEKELSEAKQENVNKQVDEAKACVMHESVEPSVHRASVEKEIDHKSISNKEQKANAHKEHDLSEKGHSQKNVHTITEKPVDRVTEAPVNPAVKSSSKDGSSTNLDALLNLQSEMLKPSGTMSSQESVAAKSGLTNLAFPVSGNVIYTQWNLGGINVMIRCSQHGNVKDATHENGYVYVTPKLEYQPMFGVEQETISEIARNWISVYVRPSCTLLRARINVFTSEILMLEEMDFQSLLPPNTTFNQFKAFGQLHRVCQKLTGLSVGSYLLTHTPGEEEVNLMKSTEGNKRGAYDFHFRHTNMMGGSQVRGRQWLPVDPSILTAQHRKMGRIPLTFQPKDCHVAKKMAGKKRKKKKQKLGEI